MNKINKNLDYKMPQINNTKHVKSQSLQNNRNYIIPSQKFHLRIPNQKSIYNQIVQQKGIIQPHILKGLKQNLKKQYQHFRSMLQQHSLRALRFTESRQKKLKNIEIQNKIKQNTMSIKQQKASINKKQCILNKSKNIQRERNKWQLIINRKKKEHHAQIINSSRFIKQWENKINESVERKNYRLEEISSSMRSHIDKVQNTLIKSIQSAKHSRKNTQISNYPQNNLKLNHNINNPQRSLSSSRKSFRLYSRVSTQEVMKKHDKLTQKQLEKSLFNTIQKQKRIKQARAVREYMNIQRKKRLSQRNVYYQNTQKDKINQIKQKIQQRNKVLNSKFNQNRKQMLDNSLPIIRNKKMKKLGINEDSYQQKSRQPNYHKHIVQKLRNMSLLIRMGMKKG